MSRMWLRGVLSLLCAGMLFATTAAAGESIKLGAAGPFTGDLAQFGEMLRNGVLLAVEEWNNKGGVLIGGEKRKVEILWGNDRGNSRQGVVVGRELVRLGVVGVVGPLNSDVAIPASVVYAAASVPMIAPAATHPELTERGFKTVFRACGRDDQQGQVAGDFITTRLRKKRVAILHDKTSYGQGLAEQTRRYLEKKGVRPVYGGVISRGEKDFTSVLASAKQKNPDLIYFGGVTTGAISLVKQMQEQLGIRASFMGGDGIKDVSFPQNAGKSAEGAYATAFPDAKKISHATEVVQRHFRRFGKDVGGFTVYSYVAASLILRAIEDTGSTDGVKLAAHLRSRMWDTALGPIQYDGKGDPTKSNFVVWQVREGKFVQVD